MEAGGLVCYREKKYTSSEKLLLNEVSRVRLRTILFSGLEAYSLPATANFNKINHFTLREEAEKPIHHTQHVRDNLEHWQKISVWLKLASFRMREFIYHLFRRWLLKDDVPFMKVGENRCYR
jgi:hypothetical protein